MTRTSVGVFAKRHRPSRSLVRLFTAGLAALSGCDKAPTTDDPNAPRIEFTQQPTDVFGGQSVTFAAHVVKAGVEVPATITYEVAAADQAFASIDAATGVLTGATSMDFPVVPVTVIATADEPDTPPLQADISVHSRVQQILLDPTAVTLTVGGQQQFTPTLTIVPNSPTEPTPVMSWHTTNTIAVSVDANGRVTALAATPAGQPALITAKAEGVTSIQAAVTVTAPAASVATTLNILVSPPASGPVLIGATRQYTAEVRDQNGAVMLMLIAPAWSIVGGSGIATINATTGVASCVGAGTVTVHLIGPANAAGVALTADQSLQCVPPLGNVATAVVFSPSTVTVQIAGIVTATASYRDVNGQSTTNGCPLVFSLDAPGIATIATSGTTLTITGVTGGSSALRATCATNGALMGIGKVQSVIPPFNVAKVTMTTETSYAPALAVASTRSFSAITLDGSGVPVIGATVSYSIVGGAAAAISVTSGVVTIGPTTGPGFRGGAVITATSGGQTDIGVLSYGDAGTIRGQVSSTLGQYLGATTVSATSGAGIVTPGVVSNDGLFYVPGLAPGAYTVRIVAAGNVQVQTIGNVGVTAGGVALVNVIPLPSQGGTR